MSDTSIERELSRYVSELELKDIPADVIHHAKLCVLDFVATSLRGSSDEQVTKAASLLEPGITSGVSTVFGRMGRYSSTDAALLNSLSSAATSVNDTHTASSSHPGMVVIPCVIALAEETGASGQAAIEAIVAGYEVMGRLGRACITPDLARFHRPTGLLGPTAAAAAAGRLLNLSPDGIQRAMSLATNTASGFNAWAGAGTMEWIFHSGFAARNGIVCARLAEAGLSAAGDILTGPAGMLAAFGRTGHAVALRANLGKTFEILTIVHKPAPACIHVQAPSQVALHLVKQQELSPDKIAHVLIEVTEAAAKYPGCDNAGPFPHKVSGQMSIQFAVASILRTGRIDIANWKDHANPEFFDLAQRCSVEISPELDAEFPEKNGARVTVTMRDGTVSAHEQPDFQSMSLSALVERLKEFSQGVLPNGSALAFLDRLDSLEVHNNVRVFLDPVRV